MQGQTNLKKRAPIKNIKKRKKKVSGVALMTFEEKKEEE